MAKLNPCVVLAKTCSELRRLAAEWDRVGALAQSATHARVRRVLREALSKVPRGACVIVKEEPTQAEIRKSERMMATASAEAREITEGLAAAAGDCYRLAFECGLGRHEPLWALRSEASRGPTPPRGNPFYLRSLAAAIVQVERLQVEAEALVSRTSAEQRRSTATGSAGDSQKREKRIAESLSEVGFDILCELIKLVDEDGGIPKGTHHFGVDKTARKYLTGELKKFGLVKRRPEQKRSGYYPTEMGRTVHRLRSTR